MDNTHEEQQPITLDQLAGMVQRGFEKTATKEDIKAVNARLDQVDTRFDQVDTRLVAIERNIKGVVYHGEFDELMKEFEDLMARVKLLEIKSGIVSGK